MDTLLKLGTKVAVESNAEGVRNQRLGKIEGYSIIQDRVVYLVKLREGFYTPQRDFYISIMVCDPVLVSAIK